MRKKLIANSFINLLGQAAPFAVGIFAIRYIIKGLGMEEYSLLTLIWAGLGYFTFLDLGLGRGIIKFLSEGFQKKEHSKNSAYFWYSMLIMTSMSLIGVAAIFFFSEPIVKLITEIPEDLFEVAVTSVKTMGFMIPLVIWTAALRGVLEADLRFIVSNLLSAFNGILNYVVPAFVIYWGGRLDDVMLFLLISRCFVFLIHAIVVFKNYPDLRRFQRLAREEVRGFISFGGWTTISNIINPMMVYFDRFVLSSMLPVAQIAYYTTPYEVISRLFIIPAAISRAIFPEISKTSVNSDAKVVGTDLFLQSFKYIMTSMYLVSLLLVVFAKWGLTIWLGDEFAENSYKIMQIFCLGIFLNALLNVPFTYIQGSGRPDATAKVHSIELPFYFLVLYIMVKDFGLVGAAVTWGVKNLIEMIVLGAICISIDKNIRKIWLFCVGRMAFLGSLLILLICIPYGTKFFITTFVIAMVSVFYIWFSIFDQRDRSFVEGFLKR